MDNTVHRQGGILFKLHHTDLPTNLSNAVKQACCFTATPPYGRLFWTM